MKFRLIESIDNILLEKKWVGLKFKDINTGRYFTAKDSSSDSNKTSDTIYFYSTNNVDTDKA